LFRRKSSNVIMRSLDFCPTEPAGAADASFCSRSNPAPPRRRSRWRRELRPHSLLDSPRAGEQTPASSCWTACEACCTLAFQHQRPERKSSAARELKLSIFPVDLCVCHCTSSALRSAAPAERLALPTKRYGLRKGFGAACVPTCRNACRFILNAFSCGLRVERLALQSTPWFQQFLR